MLDQDANAFVETLEVPTNERLQARRKRDAARARLELVRLLPEVHELVEELEAAKRARDAGDYSRLPMTRRLRSGRRPTALEEEVAARRRRLSTKQAEVEAKRIRTEALELDARESPGRDRTVTAYRLHSSRHYVTCSKGQYEQLARAQRKAPVWVMTKNGRRWWWYLDRFWWADAELSPREIDSRILTMDLASQHQREAFERAQAGLFGADDAVAEDPVPEDVRREVWIRDRGRCVDCTVPYSLAFDYILPLAAGGSTIAANLELRCRPCQARRRANESRAKIGTVRIGVEAAREWGVTLTNITWPRAS